MSISEWSDEKVLAEPRFKTGHDFAAEIVRLRGAERDSDRYAAANAAKLRKAEFDRDALADRLDEYKREVERRDELLHGADQDAKALAAQVAALRAALELGGRTGHRAKCPVMSETMGLGDKCDCGYAEVYRALADSSKAAETFTAEIRAEEKAKWETAKADLVMKAAALGADLAMGGGPAHDAAIRKAALISAAEHFDSDYWQYVTLSAHTVVVALQKLAEAK